MKQKFLPGNHKKGYKRIENGFTSIWFFPACPFGQPADRDRLWYVGTYIVSRRLVFISGGITHASFGGLGLGFYLGMNPILMAMLFSVLSAFGVEWRARHRMCVKTLLLPGYGR